MEEALPSPFPPLAMNREGEQEAAASVLAALERAQRAAEEAAQASGELGGRGWHAEHFWIVLEFCGCRVLNATSQNYML